MFFNYRETFNSWHKFCKVIHKHTEQDLSIIVQSHKILLFHNSESWVKKAGNKLFDVSMGCYDGAEVWQLVDSFILCKLASITKKSYIGVYRDDGIEIF